MHRQKGAADGGDGRQDDSAPPDPAHGALPRREAVAACLAARGRSEAPIPRWAYEQIGPRFEGPWLALTGLFAERDVANVVVPKEIAVAAGLALPAALCAVAVRLALGLRVSAER